MEVGIGNGLNSEVGMRPPARRGHRGLRPGGNVELPISGKVQKVSSMDVGVASSHDKIRYVNLICISCFQL